MRRAVALLLLALLLAACGARGPAKATVRPGPAAQSPLTPRWGAVSAWTGSESLFVGGVTTRPYPPAVDYAVAPWEEEYAVDGAAYDPARNSWRPIADAPQPIPYWYRAAFTADTLVIYGQHSDDIDVAGDSWLAYDLDDDAWRVLPVPPERAQDPGWLQVLDGRVYVLSRSEQVEVLDLATDTWTALPRSRNQPSLSQTTVTPTTEGIVVTGADSTLPQDYTVALFTLADVWDGEQWTRAGPSRQLGNRWVWTGDHMVDLDLEHHDGGEVNGYGKAYPVGGVFDPESLTFSALPHQPPGQERRLSAVSGVDGSLVAGQGWVYDDADGSWTHWPKVLLPTDQGTATTFGDGYVVYFGGFDSSGGYDDPDGLSNQTWVVRA